MNKILYLDIDEVLHSMESRYFKQNVPCPIDIKSSHRYFDEQSVGLLRDVLLVTGASIVLCSSWRLILNSSEREFLESHVLCNSIERYTPSIVFPGQKGTSQTFRGVEVAYDAMLHRPDRYVIVDDGADFFASQPLVQPTCLTGFRLNHALQCVNILGVDEDFKEYPLARKAKAYKGFREQEPVLANPPAGTFSYAKGYVTYTLDGETTKIDVG